MEDLHPELNRTFSNVMISVLLWYDGQFPDVRTIAEKFSSRRLPREMFACTKKKSTVHIAVHNSSLTLEFTITFFTVSLNSPWTSLATDKSFNIPSKRDVNWAPHLNTSLKSPPFTSYVNFNFEIITFSESVEVEVSVNKRRASWFLRKVFNTSESETTCRYQQTNLYHSNGWRVWRLCLTSFQSENRDWGLILIKIHSLQNHRQLWDFGFATEDHKMLTRKRP